MYIYISLVSIALNVGKTIMNSTHFWGIWGNGLYYSTYKNGDDWWPIPSLGSAPKLCEDELHELRHLPRPWHQLTWRLREVPARDGKIIGKLVGKPLD